jgi:cytochrome c
MAPRSASRTAALCLVGALAAVGALATRGAEMARTQTPPGAPLKMAGDAAHGKTLYQACSACHAVDDNDIGPKHRGVVGRRAASVSDYSYSQALKNSGLTWDEDTLDRWLTNPSALVPGTKMYFKLDDPQSRADVIAYLAELR